jgi:hypothetical protein
MWLLNAKVVAKIIELLAVYDFLGESEETDT